MGSADDIVFFCGNDYEKDKGNDEIGFFSRICNINVLVFFPLKKLLFDEIINMNNLESDLEEFLRKSIILYFAYYCQTISSRNRF